jgi:hypothetical protein
LPQVVLVSTPAAQTCDAIPSQRAPSASHATQLEPSLEQRKPSAQARAQQTCSPVSEGAQIPDAHSVALAQALPGVNAQPPGPQLHCAPERNSVKVQSASVRHWPKPRHRLTSRSAT